MAKKTNQDKQERLFEFGVEVDQKQDKAELTMRSKGRIPAKLLFALLSIGAIVALSILAQVSWVGKVVYEVAKRFWPM